MPCRDRGLLEWSCALLVAAVLPATMMMAEGAPPSLQELDALNAAHRWAETRTGAMRALADLTIDRAEEVPAAGRLLFILVQSFYSAGGAVSLDENARFDAVVQDAERTFGPGDPRLALVLLPRANLLIYEGRFAEARDMTERALAIQESAFGPLDPTLAEALTQMMIVATDLGRDRQGILYARRLVSLFEAQPSPNAWLAGSLGSLADLYRRVGDYPRARAAAERALQIRERVSGPEGTDTNMAITPLADVYRETGEFGRARTLYARAARILERDLGPGDATLAVNLSGLARCLSALGDHAGAKANAERAVRIVEQIDGATGRRMAFHLSALADVLARSGDHAAALEAYRRVLAIQERAYGPNHSALSGTLGDLSRLEYAVGDGRKAGDHALRAESIARARFQDVSQVLSERQALVYEGVRVSGTQAVLSILTRADRFPDRPVTPATAWDLLIRSRALVLDELGRRHHLVASGDSPDVETLARNLAGARERLVAAVLRGRGASSSADHELEVLRLADEEERLEWLLGERVPAVRDRVGLKEVAAALPTASALVGFFRYPRLPPPGLRFVGARSTEAPPEPSYLAMVLPAGGGEPVVVPLGEAAPIDEAIRRWKEAIRSPAAEHPASRERSERRYRDVARSLRMAIWDPIVPHLGRAHNLFIVPDGAIQTVSFDTLPRDGGGYLVEQGPLIHYLSAERDLVRHAAGSPRRGRLLAIGGPDFDAAFPVQAAASPAEETAAEPRMNTMPVFRSLPPACTDFERLRFQPLPGAARETSVIAALWPSQTGDPRSPAAVVLTGARASEEAFKQMAPRFSVVHLATHEFSFQDRCPSSVAATDDGRGSSESDSPLLLSGLAFAGANVRGSAAGRGDDGILTAEEIAAIDLSGLEWAVLSACDTGLGRVQDGEGVLGLRRAFEVAGAGTLIMSLWMVEDEVTHEWMRRLYEGRARGRSTAAAVHGASVGLIEERRADGRSTHPFFWGAFVAVGDWH
jgi:CHAT domain-containing protein